MKSSFFISMNPPTVTHQEQKTRVLNGKPIRYETAELKEARAKLTAYVGQHVLERSVQKRDEIRHKKWSMKLEREYWKNL